MPVYEYQCEKCSKIFEIWQKVNDKPPGRCPDCAGPMYKLVSLSSFQLKGGGWCVDGYSDISKKGKNGAKSDATENASSNSKSSGGDVKKKIGNKETHVKTV